MSLTQELDGTISYLRASRVTTNRDGSVIDTQMATMNNTLQPAPLSDRLVIGVRLDPDEKLITVNAGGAMVTLAHVKELTAFTYWRKVDIQSLEERMCSVTLVSPPPSLKQKKRKTIIKTVRSPLATLSPQSPPKLKRSRRDPLVRPRMVGKNLFSV